LEQETLQNNILFEKFIRRLDEQFQITKNLDLTSIKVGIHGLKYGSMMFFFFHKDNISLFLLPRFYHSSK
jgi:hypothetical protein